MSDTLLSTCPHCGSSFQVAREQLTDAGGRVRCGQCLQVFDGINSEIDFVPPPLPADEISHTVAGLHVAPMETAELPLTGRRKPWAALTLLLALLVALGAQFYLPWAAARQDRLSVELVRIAVRTHPVIEDALRVDAVLRNSSAEPSPYPLLFLGFTNRRGEPRARRTFVPAEYLHGDQGRWLPPYSELQISLAIADPGHGAANYVARLELPGEERN